MTALNKLENAILERLSIKYPIIKEHLSCIEIKSRNLTGVGMYINLKYSTKIEKQLSFINSQFLISNNETIQMKGLKHGLVYKVDIKDGLLNYIELATIGENWDGKIAEKFTFV